MKNTFLQNLQPEEANTLPEEGPKRCPNDQKRAPKWPRHRPLESFANEKLEKPYVFKHYSKYSHKYKHTRTRAYKHTHTQTHAHTNTHTHTKTAKKTPGSYKKGPRRPEEAQKQPKTAQEGPKTTQEGPKTAPKHEKTRILTVFIVFLAPRGRPKRPPRGPWGQKKAIFKPVLK